ncbi:DUF896 domain-containing protein [Pullulanibacillus sp. KACC 23026]|uniref:DUF896 domain-containing protein n=1 Tax=Pullulanibacillus sp. KACC 23026 TaxID=3028315 RepID=UPI0023B078B9|nr:DUF896 domain-containing protein [Pullulanibacillus sp. KACC 23026]WEG11531.1 DUF896 domain-containing protein [Pullulanibacillus sp. KACC 23026]
MLEKEKLARISELSRKSKSEGLTPAEKKEQAHLRQAYLEAFRSGFKDHLHTIKVVDPNGDDVTPLKLKQSKERRSKH